MRRKSHLPEGRGVFARAAEAALNAETFALNWISKLLAASVLVAIAVNVADVVGRNALGAPLPWAGEMLTFLLIWLVFVGVAGVTAADGHIGVDLVNRFLGPRLRFWRRVMVCGGALALSLYMIPQSLSFVEIMLASGKTSIVMGAPMWLVHSAVLAGFGLNAIVCLIRLLALIAASGNAEVGA